MDPSPEFAGVELEVGAGPLPYEGVPFVIFMVYQACLRRISRESVRSRVAKVPVSPEL